MLKIKIFFITFTLFLVRFGHCKTYTNYTLFRGMPVNHQHLQFFLNLSDVYQINFWRPPSTIYRPVEFVVPPEQKEAFLDDAKEGGVYLTTIISDLQSAFDKQTVRSYIRRNMGSFDWKSYFRLKDIYTWLKDLSKMYPNELKMFSIGKTFQNRDIMAVKIELKGSKKRSIVIVEGGIHAREWIGPAFVTYMIYQIIQAPKSKNNDLKKIASTYEWYFVPVINPDGYEYSHTEDRLWRKNRNNLNGVDINRNFGYGFGTVGVSRKSSSDIYCGPTAFSEKESKAMADLIKSKSERLEYYLAFHSYGQYMILPYANSVSHEENYNEVRKMGLEASKAIQRRYGTQYSVGTAFDTVGYTTSGVSGCWVKKQFRVPYVLTFELRDDGQDGFALPASQILPTCLETMDGLVPLLKPRTGSYKKLKLDQSGHDGQANVVFDRIIVLCNVFFVIIVRFD